MCRSFGRKQHLNGLKKTHNFHFDAEWNAHEWKRVRFVSDGYDGRIVETQVGSDNTCDLPPVHKASYIDVGVYVDDRIRTTTPLRLTCIPSILCE